MLFLCLGAAWWSMASHLAAQDYLARFQASGMSFPALGNAADLQYPSLGLHSLSSHHKSSRSSKSSSSTSSSLPKSQANTKDKSSTNSLYSSAAGDKDRSKSPSLSNSKSYLPNNKYETTLSVLSNMKPPSDSSSPGPSDNKTSGRTNDLGGYTKDKTKSSSCASSVKSGSSQPSVSASIFTSPLSLASNTDKVSASASTTQSTVNCSVSALPSPSILR